MKSPIIKNIITSLLALFIFIVGIFLTGTVGYHFFPDMPFHRLPVWVMAFICSISTFCSILSYKFFRSGRQPAVIYLSVIVIFFTAITLGSAFMAYNNISVGDIIEFLSKGGAAFIGGIIAIFLLPQKAEQDAAANP
jgi:hypothetical protein